MRLHVEATKRLLNKQKVLNVIKQQRTKVVNFAAAAAAAAHQMRTKTPTEEEVMQCRVDAAHLLVEGPERHTSTLIKFVKNMENFANPKLQVKIVSDRNLCNVRVRAEIRPQVRLPRK